MGDLSESPSGLAFDCPGPLQSACVADAAKWWNMSRVLAYLLSVFVAIPAMAQVPCAPLAATIAHLADAHQEHPVAEMIQSNGLRLILLAGPGGSFTLLGVMQSGNACLLATGGSFKPVKPGVGS